MDVARVWEADTPTLIELNRRAVDRGAVNHLSDADVASLHPDATPRSDDPEDDRYWSPPPHTGVITCCHDRLENGRLHGDMSVLALFDLTTRDRYGQVFGEQRFIETTVDDMVALPSRRVDGPQGVQITREAFAIAISDYEAESLEEAVELYRRRHGR